MDNYIVFENVDFVYNANTPFAVKALQNVNIAFPRNQVTAVIGHTGSGKSTLIQHLNVLLRPTAGSVTINQEVVTKDSNNKNLKALRKEVGVVFQFPESQLFEESVLKDVMFGPLNFDISPEEAERIAREKLAWVGLPEELYDRSPFELSGGQMRRVAIAGVLALEPSVLVLDEPTAGLDPAGHKYIMELFMRLQKEHNLTLILVTHQMEDVALYADYVIVLEKGTQIKCGLPSEIFADPDWVEAKNLMLPEALGFIEKIDDRLQTNFSDDYQPINVEELADSLLAIQQSLKADGSEV